jgi:hypothetical protein
VLKEWNIIRQKRIPEGSNGSLNPILFADDKELLENNK